MIYIFPPHPRPATEQWEIHEKHLAEALDLYETTAHYFQGKWKFASVPLAPEISTQPRRSYPSSPVEQRGSLPKTK